MNNKFLIYGFGSMGKRRLNMLRGWVEAANPGEPTNLEVTVYDPLIPDMEVLDRYLTNAATGTTSVMALKRASTETDVDFSKLDAAFICTPPDQHLRQAALLLAHGVPTLVEKPYCLLDEIPTAKRLYDWAWSQGIATWPGHNMRYHPFVNRINRLVGGGELGNLRLHTARFGQHLELGRPWEEAPSYMKDVTKGGGALQECLQDIDTYIGWASIVQRSVIDWRSVSAEVVERGAIGLLHVQGQIPKSVMIFDQLRHERLRQHELIGTKGTVTWHMGPERETLNVVTATGAENTAGGPELMVESFQRDTAAFLDAAAREVGVRSLKPPSPFHALELLQGNLERSLS